MPKLDKQGLNTFIRELDKHINTKINKASIGANAKKITIDDDYNYFNSSNVEGALNELASELNGQKTRGINIANALIDKIEG